MIGERTMNTAIFWNPDPMSEFQPAFATAAPAMPPISAWEDDVGSPRYQVSTSHAMAPISPANTTPMVNTFGCTTSLAMVLATFVLKMRKAAKLKNAAQATAILGDRTRVETTVAMEFAASWNPLKKSKERATRMVRTRAGVTIR